MKRTFYSLTVILIITLSCNSSKKNKNSEDYHYSKREIRKLLKDTTIQHNTLVSSGQFYPYRTIQIDDSKFDLVLKGIDTIYLATNDKSFITPEGFKVGMKLSELPASLTANLIKEQGWGYFIRLPSKWALGFCEGSSCTDNYPTNSSKVKWVFKRH